jgi:DNA integrity scanning protein DisA with diadenylate cyclase activity
MPDKPGRPANSLPTATHLLNTLERYKNETNIIFDNLTYKEIKERLSIQIVQDQLEKRKKNKKQVEKWRTKNAK